MSAGLAPTAGRWAPLCKPVPRPAPARYALVIEDEPAISDVLATSLRGRGFITRELTGAVGIADALTPSPSLIALDVSLAESDAVEVLQKLAAEDYSGDVLLVSGASLQLLDDIQRVGRWRGLRMLPPLRKPFRLEDLASIGVPETGDLAGAKPRTNLVLPQHVDCAEALERGWVEVWYQPKCAMTSGRVVGAECLARVRHPRAGILLPGSFLPGATTEALEDLTSFVIQQACRDWAVFSRSNPGLRLAVNVPSGALVSMPLATLVRDSVPAGGGRWPGLVLEITEEEACRHVEQVHEIATQLSIYGVDLSIDDFGIGYSNLSRLRDFPFREVKIDRSIVQDCHRDTVRSALCRAVVDLAHACGASVVAEGIESRADFDCLAGLGCDVAQGYLLGRPMPAGAFDAWLGARQSAG